MSYHVLLSQNAKVSRAIEKRGNICGSYKGTFYYDLWLKWKLLQLQRLLSRYYISTWFKMLPWIGAVLEKVLDLQ